MNQPMKAISVSELNAYVAGLIKADKFLQTIYVEGEISNLSVNNKSRHMYFSLKDRDGVVRAVMFSRSADMLKFRPVDGMKVLVRAQLTVYEPFGQYQLMVFDMLPSGVGVMAMQLEQLKKKLTAEGLFAPEHKKPIPKIPSTVGVITSPTGAAVRDIMNILHRRFPCVEIVLAPVQVQGAQAAPMMIDAVNRFSKYGAADVIIIGRGGGSMEDLWAFNDEGLARAIYHCGIPVISAVGHETDFTICDFVSDLRAPTPSAAAELAVPDKNEIENRLEHMHYRSSRLLRTRTDFMEHELERLFQLIAARSPKTRQDLMEKKVMMLTDRARIAAERNVERKTAAARELIAKCEALNPLAVLARGFSFVSKEGECVSSVGEVNIGDTLDIRFKDGSVRARVSEK